MSDATSTDAADSQISYIEHANAGNFAQTVLQRSFNHPVLVDFWAGWCAPCGMLLPILEKLVRTYEGKISLAKVNTDEEQALAMQFGVRSLPTVKLFRNGEVADEFTGVQREETICQMIEHYLEKPADKILQAADAKLAASDTSGARELLEQLLDEEPDNNSAQLRLVAVHLAADDPLSARTVFSKLKMETQNSDEGALLAARIQFATALIDAPDKTTLETQVSAHPNDLQARYFLSARHLLAGQYESALQHLLEIMKRDRSYGDDLARKSLIAAFRLIDNPKIVTRYRQRMAALMF